MSAWVDIRIWEERLPRRDGDNHRQRRESHSTVEDPERVLEEEAKEVTGGHRRCQAALLSERLTKLDSMVVVRAVRVPSSGGARDERTGVRGTGAHPEPTLRPGPCLAPYWSGQAARSW